jgi:cell division protein FtsQ
MLKKIFGILAVLLALAYLVFAIVHFSGSPSAKKCTELSIVLKDTSGQAYVSPSEIREILTNKHCRIVGKQLLNVDFQKVERLAETHKMVSRAECFSTPSGQVILNIWQIYPVLRIMQDGGSYYIDEKGQRSGISFNSAADVPVASGVIRDSTHVRRLYRMAMMLRRDPFWNAQIEQIYVAPNGEWILIPCVGDYEIEFGLPNDVEEKLQRLRLFYQKALPKVGWERYSKISVKYKNQIVCTKKEE